MPEKWELRQYQDMPLDVKVSMSEQRIIEWYDHFHGDVYISFSGGKDSTVLTHLVHGIFPGVPLVFVNTGLEYPEIQAFARKMGAQFLRPAMQFSEVISTYGYPVISKEVSEAIEEARVPGHLRTTLAKRMELEGLRMTSAPRDKRRKPSKSIYNKEKWMPLCRDTMFKISNRCCDVMKKAPAHVYHNASKLYPYIGTLASESRLRTQSWLKYGCNSYDGRFIASRPMSFWTEQDVLTYILNQHIEIASVYGDIIAADEVGYEYVLGVMCNDKLKCSGCERTGCIFCGFGTHLEKGESRFQALARTHPKQYEHCLGGGQWVDNPDYDPLLPKMDGTWENWNPKKIWVPSKEGLGMKYVFDECNRLYGKDFIRYD